MALFFVALTFLFILGYLAQTTGLCLVRGVVSALDRRPQFLIAILCSGAFGWVSLLVAESLSIAPAFRTFAINWLAFVGGLMFGVGAALNAGCGVSTISKLARGDTVMLATLSGWVIGWVMLSALGDYMPPSQAHTLPSWHFPMLMMASGLIIVGLIFFRRLDVRLWLSMITIGLMASLTFLYEPRWTPSGYLSDFSASVWESDGHSMPSIERSMLLLALLAGMAVAALKTRSFKLNLQNWRIYQKHLLAGILMGVGASLAGGGNDSQLLLSLPALSLSGLAAVVSMLFGIVLGIRMQKYFRATGTHSL